MIRKETISVSGSLGGNGASTANTTSSNIINGTIRAIHLAYVGSPPAGTTDVTVAGVTTPAVSLLAITDAATDGWFFPMAQAQITTGASITNQGTPLVINDYVKATIAEANDADGVTVTILYEG